MPRFGICTALFFSFTISSFTFAQNPGTGSTVVPMPGVGHDYVKAISETVDPGSGSVSLRIAVPMPKGRGLTLPFSFAYDSNGVFFPPAWKPFVTGFMSSGGWSYTIPAVGSDNGSYTAPGTQVTCGYNTNYRFVDGAAARRELRLFVMLGTNPACAGSNNVWSSRDINTQSVYSPASGVQVVDADGTIYNFSGGSYGGIARLIEDRNGNQINVTTSGTSGAFTETDTLGRPVLSSSGFGTTGNTVAVSGLGAPYTLTWESPSYNFTIGSALVYNGNNYACSFTGSTSGTRSVVKSIQLPNGQSYSFKYGTDDPNNSNSYGLISQVTYPSGGWIKYSWGGNPQSAGGVFPNLQGQAGQCFWRWGKPVILTRTISFDGVNVAQKQTYQYSTAWGPTGNAQSYLWSSKTTTVTTQDLIKGTSFVTTYLYAAADSGEPTPVAPPVGSYYTVETQIPVEQTITHQDVGGSTLETVNKTWYNAQQLQSEQDTFGSVTSQKKYTYGLGGQLTEEDEFDFGQTTATRKTINTYQPFAATPLFPSLPSILDKPCKTIIYDSGGNAAAETDYYYDGGTSLCASTTGSALTGTGSYTAHDETLYGTSATVARGNVTQKVEWLSGGTSPTTTYTYDETGQVLSLKDPCGNSTCADVTGTAHTTTYSYTDSYSSGTPPGASNAYVTTITHPAVNGVTTHNYYQYAYSDGQLTSSQDDNDKANSKSTSYQYSDNLRRLTQTNYPDGGQTTYAYSDAGPTPSQTEVTLLQTGTSITTTTVMDGVGHVTQTQLTTDPDGADYTDTSYDGLGRVSTRSNPHRSSALSTDGTTTYRYDALGRTCLQVPPDATAPPSTPVCPASSTGSVVTAYTNNCETVTDEAGNSRKSCSDGLGRMTGTWEAPNVTGYNYETDYTYDTLNNLKSVTQKGGSSSSSNWRLRSFGYDSLSRLTSAANPEAGTTNYTYDVNGNLSTKVAPQPNQTGTAIATTNYSYDALNRLTGKSYVGLTTPGSSYFYDQTSYNGLTISNGVGRRTGMNDGSGASAWNYDARGRVAAIRRTINGIANTATYTYSPYLNSEFGNLTYFSGSQVAYTWNGADRPLSAIDPYPINFVKSAAYSPAGALTSAAFGAYNTGFTGTAVTNSYNNRLQPIVLSAATPTLTVFSLSYNFNQGTQSAPQNNGNVVTIQNNRDSTRTQTFTYDPLNRIASAQTPSSTLWGDTYVIDPWGNLLQKNMIANKGGENLQISALANNQLTGMTYDAAGNLINDGMSHSYVYDAENRMISAGGMSYLYDGEGNRVEKCTAGSTAGSCVAGATGTLYWIGKAGETLNESDLTAANWKRFVYFNGKMVARRDSATGNVYYFYSDHLGSVGVVTDALGQAVENESDYYPYGGERVITSALSDEHYKFTDKERDLETGLDYFGARYYTSALGRFMTPDDDSDQHAYDPQSWNLYGYVRNNPLNNTDPTGNACVDGKDDDQGGETCAQVAASDATYLKDGKASATVTATASSWDHFVDNMQWGVNYTLEQTVGQWLGSFDQASRTKSPYVFALSMAALVAPFGEGQESETIVQSVIRSSERAHSAQITAAERALAKKLGRAAAEGSASAFSGVQKASATALVRDIMSNPTRVVRGAVTTDVYNAAGQGVRFENGTNKFVGFLESSKATR